MAGAAVLGRRQLWVDMHSHLFNAADVPVRGFLTEAYLKKWPGKTGIAWLAAQVARLAPTAAADMQRLDELIATQAQPSVGTPRRLGRWPAPVRLAHMVRETTRSRIDLAYRLDALCRNPRHEDEEDVLPIDIYVPLGVDFEHAVGDPTSSRVLGQFDVMERLAAASIKADLKSFDAVILPMVGFDPCRRRGDPVNGLDKVKERVCSGRAVGVKLYPPMGFFPLDNPPDVDAVLEEFYEWCVQEDVPVVAHCSRANSVCDTATYAHPDGWRRVLDDPRFAGLRLSLAHAGGMQPGEWFTEASQLVSERPNVWCDISNHDFQRGDLIARLIARCKELDGMVNRVMFATDYWFSLMHAGADHFVSEYADRFSKEFDDLTYRQFTGGSARHFLGFDDPSNKNRRRVIAWALRTIGMTSTQIDPAAPPPWPVSFERLLGSPSASG